MALPDEDGALSEIRRVLAPRGRLLIYNLPQRYSYKELLIGGLRLGFHTSSGIRSPR